jgi:hypothetical protein
MFSALWPLATFPVEGARRTATPCVSPAFSPTPRHTVADRHATWLRPLVPAILRAAAAADEAAADQVAGDEAAAGAGEEAASAAEAKAEGEAEANSNEATRVPPDAAVSRRFRKASTLPPTVVRRPYLSKGS